MDYTTIIAAANTRAELDAILTNLKNIKTRIIQNHGLGHFSHPDWYNIGRAQVAALNKYRAMTK